MAAAAESPTAQALGALREQTSMLVSSTSQQLQFEAEAHRSALAEERRAFLNIAADLPMHPQEACRRQQQQQQPGNRRGSCAQPFNPQLEVSSKSLMHEMAAAKGEVVALSQRLLMQLQATNEQTVLMSEQQTELERRFAAETAQFAAEREAWQTETAQQHQATQAEKAQLEHQLGAATMRGQQLEGELCGLQAAQKVTVVELAQCREAAGLLRQECDGLKAELGRERKETERLSRQNTGLERKLEVDEVSLLRRRLAETEARLEDCRDELQRQRPLASKASQYEAAMHAEVQANVELKIALVKAEAEARSASSRQAEAERLVEQALDNTVKLQDEIEGGRKREATLVAAEGKASHELVAAQREVGQLTGYTSKLAAENVQLVNGGGAGGGGGGGRPPWQTVSPQWWPPGQTAGASVLSKTAGPNPAAAAALRDAWGGGRPSVWDGLAGPVAPGLPPARTPVIGRSQWPPAPSATRGGEAEMGDLSHLV